MIFGEQSSFYHNLAGVINPSPFVQHNGIGMNPT